MVTCAALGEDYTIAIAHFLPPSLPPSLRFVPYLHNRGYVAAGLDKKEISFEVDDKILS